MKEYFHSVSYKEIVTECLVVLKVSPLVSPQMNVPKKISINSVENTILISLVMMFLHLVCKGTPSALAVQTYGDNEP